MIDRSPAAIPRIPPRPARATATITDARVIVTCPGRNFVTLKITTADGTCGLGDATLNGREMAVVAYLEAHVVPLLIGRDAHRIEDMWQFLYRGAYWPDGNRPHSPSARVASSPEALLAFAGAGVTLGPKVGLAAAGHRV